MPKRVLRPQKVQKHKSQTLPPSEPLIASLAQVRDVYNESILEFLGNKEKVMKIVEAEIQGATTDIVLGALGFEKSWGRIQFDHCNGRKTEFQDWVMGYALEAAKKWFKETLGKDTLFPKLSARGVEEMRRVYREAYRERLHQYIERAAQSAAQADVTKFIEQLTKTPLPVDHIPPPKPPGQDVDVDDPDNGNPSWTDFSKDDDEDEDPDDGFFE